MHFVLAHSCLEGSLNILFHFECMYVYRLTFQGEYHFKTLKASSFRFGAQHVNDALLLWYNNIRYIPCTCIHRFFNSSLNPSHHKCVSRQNVWSCGLFVKVSRPLDRRLHDLSCQTCCSPSSSVSSCEFCEWQPPSAFRIN